MKAQLEATSGSWADPASAASAVVTSTPHRTAAAASRKNQFFLFIMYLLCKTVLPEERTSSGRIGDSHQLVVRQSEAHRDGRIGFPHRPFGPLREPFSSHSNRRK